MSIYSQIEYNNRRTWIIMAVFISLITLVAFVFGEASGYGLSYAGIALIISGIMSFFSYYYSDSLILAISGAKQIQEKDDPRLFRTVQNLCIGSGLPMPRIYIIDDTAPNAFATGRDPNHSAVCVTSGLLQKLDKLELEGVIAHELSHIKNYDIRLQSIVVILIGLVTLLADWFMRSLWLGNRNSRENRGGGVIILIGIVLAILSPIFATLIQLSISRKRELLADASGSLLTRYPEGLASALVKISKDKEPLEAANNATAHLYIIDPFKGKDAHAWFSNLFNTHPPVEERVKILRSM